MARLQCHLGQFRDVPCRDDHPTRVRIFLDLLHHGCDLIDHFTGSRLPRAPLYAVDRPEVAVLLSELIVVQNGLLECAQFRIPLLGTLYWQLAADLGEVVLEGPLRPDVDVALQQIADVAIALEEPDQLLSNRVEAYLLGGDEGEPLCQVEADLPTEHAARARAGTITLVYTVFEDVPQEVFVRCIRHYSPHINEQGTPDLMRHCLNYKTNLQFNKKDVEVVYRLCYTFSQEHDTMYRFTIQTQQE